MHFVRVRQSGHADHRIEGRLISFRPACRGACRLARIRSALEPIDLGGDAAVGTGDQERLVAARWCAAGVHRFASAMGPGERRRRRISSHPGGGGVVIFLFLVICTVVAAWPLLTGVLSKRRLLGTTAVVAILTLFAITNWSDLSKAQQQVNSGLTGGFVTVSAGSGLVLYTVGVVVLCVLIVRLWLFRRRAPQTGAPS